MENEIVKHEQSTEASTENAFKDTQNFNNLYKMATMLAKTALIPQSYQGKPEDCLVAIEMANRMNVSPMMVMQNLYVVKGKPSWSGQACMTLIANCGKFKDIRPVYTGEKGMDTRGCYVRAVRLIDGEVVEGTEITIQMAKDEKWYSKKDKCGNETSKWQTMPEQMLAYRAAAFFARVWCPETLMGVQLAEEVLDIAKPDRVETVDPFARIEERDSNAPEIVDINPEILEEAEGIFQ